MPSADDEVSYAFGSFRLDTRAGELRCNDIRLPLRPKVFQLLLLFVENPGRLMPKGELLEKLWPETHVEEGSLTRSVASLRSTLKDSSSRPEYVETVTRRGYRFVANVQKIGMEGSVAKPARFQLVAEDRCYPLIDGENVVGRADDCEVCLNLASISRHHAVIVVEATRVTVRDLQSKNGTFVRGRRVDASVDLGDGDEVRLGSVPLTFIAGSGDRSTVTTPRHTTRPRQRRDTGSTLG